MKRLIFIICLFGLLSCEGATKRWIPKITAAAAGGLTVANTFATNFTTGATTFVITTPSFGNASRVVISIANEVQNNHTASVTSVPTYTWSLRATNVAGATSGSVDIFDTTTTASGALVITGTLPNGGWLSAVVYEITGAEVIPGGATNWQSASSAMSVTLTTTRASSIAISAASNWNAANGARTYRTPSGLTSNTETKYDPQNPSHYTGLHFRSLLTTAQAYALGFTAPSDGSSGWGCCSYEVRTP